MIKMTKQDKCKSDLNAAYSIDYSFIPYLQIKVQLNKGGSHNMS